MTTWRLSGILLASEVWSISCFAGFRWYVDSLIGEERDDYEYTEWYGGYHHRGIFWNR